MQHYEFRQVFSRTTGQPDGEHRITAGHFCDNCGHPIERREQPDAPDYAVFERSEAEPMFDHLVVPGHPEVDVYKVFDDGRFVYCTDLESESGLDCSYAVPARAAAEKLRLFEAMYKYRLQVVGQLLDDGVPPRELGLTDDD